MMNNINALIESLGLGLQKRALHIQFANPILNTQVFLQRIQGQHFINEGLKLELLCLSTNVHIQLKQFIGTQVAVDQVTDFGKLARTTGIITAASQGQSDGALTLYKLTLEDATSLWHKRRNSRVFMNKSVLEMTEVIFKEWQNKSPLFAASLSLSIQGLKNDYDIRPFVMQANETDYDFLTRLWRSEGINWLVDEAEKIVGLSAQTIQAQKLRLIDQNSQYEALERRNIRFHRSSATERFDTISSFIAKRSIQSNTIQVQRWQSDILAQDQGDAKVSSHLHSEQQDNETLSLEQAWTISPAWISDLNGEDQTTASGRAQIEKLNTQLSQYQDLQSKYFNAMSSVRDAHVGYWFEFIGHPEIDQHQGSDREFLILGKYFYNQNNLPKDLNKQVDALLDLSRWQSSWRQQSQDERQANELTVIRRNIAVVPEYDPFKHRPAAYPQRAKVVGPEGETIYVDQWGRIKVRFVFTRSDDHGHDGGAGSNDNDTDSAWVDVLTSWAGEGYGSRFHPRIGEIVVIDFFDGNVDRPFVVGRLHEAERHQTMFDVKGQLPDTKKLSGIRSQEVAGAGFNQLRFDDTTGQISTQLQSSHAVSQLNLGNLSHPKEQATADGRGEGFELRTDAYGAVRAGKGMLITTYTQENAIADHLEAAQAQSLLQQGHEGMTMLSQIAEKQQTDALNVIGRLPKLIQSLQIQNPIQAVAQTLNLFESDLTSNPLSALKNCESFIEDIGALSSGSNSAVQSFKDAFVDSQEAMSNLKETICNLEEMGTDKLQAQLAQIKASVDLDPIGVLKKIGGILLDVKTNPEDLIIGGGFGQAQGITPKIALDHVRNFMQLHANDLENSKDERALKTGKLFRQALMLLASPNGIALTTPEDIVLHASSDIATSAQGSINLSAQKNLIAHAQDKISLFAAQKGLRAYAAKGKLELQAQDDAIEAIARKVIKLISTEDKIEITSPKEIILTAGGSQLKINSSGVFSTTGGKFESKAGQHVFTQGERINLNNIELPKLDKSKYSIRFAPFGNDMNFDLMGLIDQKYKIINKSSGEELSAGIVSGSKLPRIYGESADDVELIIGEENWKIDVEKITSIDISISDSEDGVNLYPKINDFQESNVFIESEMIDLIINNK